jgi:hypothetical protein
MLLDVETLLLLRVYLTLRAKPHLKEKAIVVNGIPRCFNDLENVMDQIKDDPRRRSFFMMQSRNIAQVVENVDMNLLFQLYSRIIINFTPVRGGSHCIIGSAIYIGASAFKHSCQPNAAHSFKGKHLQVRAMTSISEGEAITVNYFDIRKPLAERQAIMELVYYRKCNCPRCKSEKSGDVIWTLITTLHTKISDHLSVLEQSTLPDAKAEACRVVSTLSLEMMPYYVQIFGEFHPEITILWVQIIQFGVKGGNLNEDAVKKAKLAVQVTYGDDHPLMHYLNSCLQTNKLA